MKDCGTPKVLEIKCPGGVVMLHKVLFPAELGDDETNPPYNGQYRNVILEYEANGHIWMFSSDGIPTFVSNGKDEKGTVDYEELINKPQINDVELVGNVTLEDLGITDLVDEEADAREQADTVLQAAIDAEATTRSQADILLENAIEAEATAREAAIDAEESARIAADNDIISRIPVVNDATLTIQKNGSTVATFTANDADNVTADISVPTKTSDITNDSGFITNTVNDLTNYYTKTESDTALTNEATTRADADTNLQEQIDAISSSSDVVDVVGTYAELQAYDTSKLHDNDIIKVLTDETHDDAISYYRWIAADSDFDYIGSQGPFYTKSETDATFVPQTRTVNNKPLSTNISLTASDVGALPDSTVIPTVNDATLTIQKNGASVATFTANSATNTTANISVPTKTSDLTNDSNFPVDANYVHTDNNYTTAEKNKLAGIAAGAEVNVQSDWNQTNSSADDFIKNKPSIPDSTSDLINDSGFIDNSVNNLTNYYKKSETYTKTEVNGLLPTKTSDLTNDGADGSSTYVEADELATVATTGSYNDLSNKPTIPAAQIQSDWGQTTTTAVDYIKNKPTLATVATSGSYNDLTNKPTIPAAQVNSDWNASSGVAQILNKPNLATVATSGSYNDLTDKPADFELVEMSYGESNAWAKFIDAYRGHKIVYCRASSNSNPATGTQGRKAFMAYVNNAENPTEVEFQYVRSVSTKTSSQPVDQVFVYKLTNANGGTWTVQTRDMGPKLAQGTNTTVSYSNGTYTISASQPTVPTKTSDLTNDGSDGTSTYVEADDLATVATTGSYNDLVDKPSIPSGQIQSDWTQTNTSEVDYIKNKPTLATVATSGSYNDLSNKPTIPTVNNATLTIQKNGTNVETFTANSSTNKTANIVVPTKTSDVTNDGADGTSTYVEADELATVATSGSYNDLSNKPTVGNATLTIQKNGASAGTFTANATSNKTINITVPTTAADVSALPSSTKYGASIAVSINTTDYKVTTTLKDQDGNTLGTAQVIDLPLESVVVSGSYDSTNKKIVLTLQNGNTIDIPVADLVAGLQTEITSTNKLASDLVDDTNQTHKFMTSAEKTKLSGIAAGAEVNVQANWTQTTTTADDYIKNKPTLATVATSGSYNDLSNKPTIPTVNNGTLTIQKNGTNVQTFTANQSSNATANITVPTKTSDITNDSGFITSSGTVAKADQLTNARTIAISGGVTGTATSFNGTSNISIPVTGMYETYLNWGNQNLSGRVSPIDAALSEEFSANRLAYMDASKITIEYSRDGGSTWTDYGLTNAQKVGLVTTSQAIYTGGTNSNAASNYQVRVDLHPTNPYMSTRKLFIYISTGGVSNAQVLVERKGMNDTAYTTVTTATISGWSGWNSIPLAITFGGTSSWSNSNLRLTFSYNGKSTDYPNAQLNISKIRLYGETAWSAPSNLATNGHLYTYDTSQNATFPADVSVTGSLKHGSYTYTLPNKNGTVAMTSDLPTVNNATLTIQKNGSNVQTFTANQSTNATANITVPTKTSDLTNDSNFVTSSSLAAVATSGSYNDLSNKPTIPAAQVQSNWTQTTTTAVDYIKNKPTLATVATSGSYNDLTNKPTIPAAQVQSNWTQTTTTAVDYIKNKPTLATVATSGSYNDLSNKPTIPTVNNATLTIQKNGSTVKTFTANASSNVTANITVPTKTSDITNDSDFTTNATAQKFAIGQGSTNPVFDDMVALQTIEWDVSDTTYRPIYQMANTGWTQMNMDITVAYRVTVTGTNIHSVTDVVDRWHSPTSWPISSFMCRTLSTSAATTGLKYLRAVYPTSSYLNNATYPLGVEIEMHNTTARHVKVEVFKTHSSVTWNSTKPSGSIYVNSTYNGNRNIEIYATRGWRFHQPTQMYANSAGQASYIADFEAVNTAVSELKSGATALVAGHYAYLADDGLVYDISDTAHNIAMGESKIGFINSAVNANTAISWTYWRAISRPSATQVNYFNHGTIALGNRVFLRCTMDSSGNIHSDNYLATSMAAGYTWMPFGWARSTSQIYVDTRFPMFYTLDSNGKLSHINGKAVAGTTYTAGAHINITGSTIKAIDYVHSESPVSTSSVTPIVTNQMISDGTITFAKTATGEFLKLQTTTTDPGAGSALAANTLLGVYEA